MDNTLRIIFGLGMAFIIVMTVCYLVYAIGLLKMFHKMGEPGWKAFIPFVNLYTLYKRVWEGKYFWLQMLFIVVVQALNGYRYNSAFVRTLVWAVCAASLAIKAIVNYKQSKAFGAGVGMTIILFIMPSIGTMMLGFGGYQYLGPQTDAMSR